MNILEVINDRRSARAFRPDSISRETIAKIQQAYENDSPLYAAEEASRRIIEY
jgi:hypothetical protein